MSKNVQNEIELLVKFLERIGEKSKEKMSDDIEDILVHNIERVGEVLKTLVQAGVKEFDVKEWKQWIRTRDRMVHYYYYVDREILLEIAKTIPTYIESAKKVLLKYK